MCWNPPFIIVILVFRILINTFKLVNSTNYHSWFLVFEFTFNVTYFRRVIDIYCMRSYLVYLTLNTIFSVDMEKLEYGKQVMRGQREDIFILLTDRIAICPNYVSDCKLCRLSFHASKSELNMNSKCRFSSSSSVPIASMIVLTRKTYRCVYSKDLLYHSSVGVQSRRATNTRPTYLTWSYIDAYHETFEINIQKLSQNANSMYIAKFMWIIVGTRGLWQPC